MSTAIQQLSAFCTRNRLPQPSYTTDSRGFYVCTIKLPDGICPEAISPDRNPTDELVVEEMKKCLVREKVKYPDSLSVVDLDFTDLM